MIMAKRSRMARLPLGETCVADSPALSIVCDDCGHSVTWTRHGIAAAGISNTATINEIGSRLVCSRCRSNGGLGGNIVIRPAFAARGTMRLVRHDRG